MKKVLNFIPELLVTFVAYLVLCNLIFTIGMLIGIFYKGIV